MVRNEVLFEKPEEEAALRRAGDSFQERQDRR